MAGPDLPQAVARGQIEILPSSIRQEKHRMPDSSFLTQGPMSGATVNGGNGKWKWKRKQKVETESGNGKRKRKSEKGNGRHCNRYIVQATWHARPGYRYELEQQV